jgi:hypothetical protein
MNLHQFYEKVAELPNAGYKFYFRDTCEIRLHKNNHEYCPITAVYNLITDVYNSTNLALDVGTEGLGLSTRDALTIIHSSDGSKRSKTRKSILRFLQGVPNE